MITLVKSYPVAESPPQSYTVLLTELTATSEKDDKAVSPCEHYTRF